MPKTNYKIISWHADLLDCSLLRTVKDNNFYDYQHNEVKADYIVTNTDHLRDFSTNLLSVFEEEDSKIWINKAQTRADYFLDLWVQGNTVKEPCAPLDFKVNQESYYFYLAIADIHGKSISYSFENKPGFNGLCKVIHTPTNSNFWHFSVRWLNHKGEDVHELKANWRPLLSAARNLIKIHGTPHRTKHGIIKDVHYVN